MAVDKLVDSTQLDADLTSVANAIRTKGGTSAQMAFPNGFVSAVQAIPTGSGYTLTQFAANLIPLSGLQTIADFPLRSFGLREMGNASTPWQLHLEGKPSQGLAYNAKGLTIIVIEGNDYVGTAVSGRCSQLEIYDTHENRFASLAFENCSALTTVILRHSAVLPINNANIFNGTRFASGGAGGTIYIPKSLYDHLGDGTANDYKAATNWSTINGYGTITWAKIEGSQYENYYADGTPIT